MILVADAEWDGDRESKIHCISLKELNKGEVQRFTDMDYFKDFALDKKPEKWVFHNGMSSDLPVINKLTGLDIKPESIIDTFVVSRTVNYSKFRTHSLKELGEYLRVYKGDYTGGWDEYTEEMGDYCDQDVIVEEAIVNYFWKYIKDPKWEQALKVEHEMAAICSNMQRNGFLFDVDRAKELLDQIKEEKEELEVSFRAAFGSKLVESKRIKYRTKKDGSLFSNVITALSDHPKTEIEGDELVCYDYKDFNPGSPQDRIDSLWEAGWNPHEKTLGHIKAIREARKGGTYA